ncbi:MAG: guanylate kinase [Planctomycetota bacterium]
MRRTRRGLILLLSGPAGAGKTTLSRRLCEARADCVLSISATTRPPRGREKDGVEYFFLSPEAFEARAAQGGFAEHAEFCGHRYGTPEAFLEEKTRQGRNVVLDIEVKGAARIRRRHPDAVMIFLLPPTPEVLVERLLGRGTETRAEAARRMETARNEILRMEEYDYCIVNDDLERAFQALGSIVESETHRIRGGECDAWLGGRDPSEVLKV